jgi:hypothetical protein
MNPWVPFVGALVYNYRRHRRREGSTYRLDG